MTIQISESDKGYKYFDLTVLCSVNYLIIVASKFGDSKRLTYWHSFILVASQCIALQSCFLFG